MRESSECQAHKWKSMTSRMLLREVTLSCKKNKHFPSVVFIERVIICCVPRSLLFSSGLGEDPLAGDQNDHDMDSIAGVLKLYFRGLDHALFPKEVFHDLISCVCKCYFLLPVCVFINLRV